MEKKFLERTLEQIIYSHRETIHEYGLPKMYKNTLRQFKLPSGKIIDLLSFDIKDNVFNCLIFELKKENVDENTVIQAYNYLFELSALFNKQFFGWEAKIILIGSMIKPMPILNSIDFQVELYNYEYKIDGIKFKKIEPPSTNFDGDKDFCNIMRAIKHEFIDNPHVSIYKQFEYLKNKDNTNGKFFTFLEIATLLDCSISEAMEYVKNKLAETSERPIFIKGIPLYIQ